MSAETIKIPAHVQRYADILGVDDAVKFLLTFGGTDLYVPHTPQTRSQLVQTIGRHKAEMLGRAFGGAHIRVPVAKPFIARALKAKNMTTAAIARELHVTDVTVRKYLSDRPSTKQLGLFD